MVGVLGWVLLIISCPGIAVGFLPGRKERKLVRAKGKDDTLQLFGG